MNTVLNRAQDIFNKLKSRSEKNKEYFNQFRSFSTLFLQLLNEKKGKNYLLEVLEKPYPRNSVRKHWMVWKEIIKKEIQLAPEEDWKKIFGYLKWLSKIEAEKFQNKVPNQKNRQYKKDFKKHFKK